MAMGTRDPEPPLWIATSDLPVSPSHPFYTRLNALLDADGFDAFVEEACRTFTRRCWAARAWRRVAFRRCWSIFRRDRFGAGHRVARGADSLAVRSFLRLGLEQAAPDHSTISRTRRLIDVETHRAVFTWVQQRLVAAGLLQGRRSRSTPPPWKPTPPRRIVRRYGGDYQAYHPPRRGLRHQDPDAGGVALRPQAEEEDLQ